MDFFFFFPVKEWWNLFRRFFKKCTLGLFMAAKSLIGLLWLIFNSPPGVLAFDRLRSSHFTGETAWLEHDNHFNRDRFVFLFFVRSVFIFFCVESHPDSDPRRRLLIFRSTCITRCHLMQFPSRCLKTHQWRGLWPAQQSHTD